jgi:nicotinamide riboside transporter PnuC
MEHNNVPQDGTSLSVAIGLINSFVWVIVSIISVIPWLQAGALLLSAIASYYTIKKNKQKGK